MMDKLSPQVLVAPSRKLVELMGVGLDDAEIVAELEELLYGAKQLWECRKIITKDELANALAANIVSLASRSGGRSRDVDGREQADAIAEIRAQLR